MDVKLTSEQHDLLRSIKGVLARHRQAAGPGHPSESDLGATKALEEAGLLEILTSGGSEVDALLLVEQAAASAPGAPVAGRAYVAPMVTDRVLPSVIALVERPSGSIARHAPIADAFLVSSDDTGGPAFLATREQVDLEPISSRWGYSVARVELRGGEALGEGSGERLYRAWQTALAAEAGGLMEAAVLHATSYVSGRFQFGRPIGSLQGLQHRLAHAYVKAQGAKWLARRSAWDPGDDLAAGAAATYGIEAIREVMSTVQQVCGAIGITDEFGLTRYTARMARLQTELGGPIQQARRLGRRRWGERVPAAASVR